MEKYDKQVLDLAMEAGKILMDAGAEIFRVEETIIRIARAYGIEKCNTFCLSTGIMITAEGKSGQIYAQVKHIPFNTARLYRVAAVNQLSREIEEGKYSVEDAREKLEEIRVMQGMNTEVRILASGVGSASFCCMLGGNAGEAFAAFLTGLILYAFLVLLERREKNTSKIVVNILGGILVSFFALFFSGIGIGESTGNILVGALMPLLPGMSFVNGIRDLADGDYIGGSVRMLDAVLVALGIALGVGIVYTVYFNITGGILL